MDFGHYAALRPFGYSTTLHIGFAAFLSNHISGRTERTALHLVNRRRMLAAQDVVDAIVSGADGLSLMARTDILAGSAMCSAVADLSVALAECIALYARAPRTVVSLRPHVDVCHPRLASESAYLALTLCVIPTCRGYLESYEMDQGVRLVKAGMLVTEYDGFKDRIRIQYGDPELMSFWPTEVATRVAILDCRLRCSILSRLRRLSLAFVPVVSWDKPFPAILSRVRGLCIRGGSCYRVAQSDPNRPQVYKLRDVSPPLR